MRVALDLHARLQGGGVVVTYFHGGETDQRAFLAALERNCECDVGENGILTRQCGLHAALLTDQKWIDRQEFGRFLREKLLEEEWRGPARP